MAANVWKCGVAKQIHLLCAKRFSTSVTYCAGEKWRLQNNMGRCGNEYGPLTDTPDWSFADGRPAPLNPREKRKLQKKKEMTERIVKLMGEMKLAKEIHKDNLEAQKEIERKVQNKRIKTRR